MRIAPYHVRIWTMCRVFLDSVTFCSACPYKNHGLKYFPELQTLDYFLVCDFLLSAGP